MADEVLVIKLGALGDFVQALGPMAAIRRHHGGARVTLLTTAPYADFARASGLVDEVWIDDRPRGLRPGPWLALRRRLRSRRFAWVYDLQTSDRSSFYFHLMGPGRRPRWSGIARGCSHPHRNPDRDRLHTLDRQAEQLRDAGIAETPAPDLSWAAADVGRFGLAQRYVLLVPGGAPHRPAKRWPAALYGALARGLADAGLQPVLLGTASEARQMAEVNLVCPAARSLAGETDFLDIAVLARGAAGAVGNDTGPMHLIAAAGCPSVVLYSHESDPALCAQRGPRVQILRRPVLEDLSPADVRLVLDGVMGGQD
ncbi:MAG: glycosyltransferase family 9 protein [Hyphomicrobiales bacterium]|nr:glycosyltransferase family 9 protein [Hyphomicrobiales bacterium]